jgi:hypothetical protein
VLAVLVVVNRRLPSTPFLTSQLPPKPASGDLQLQKTRCGTVYL